MGFLFLFCSRSCYSSFLVLVLRVIVLNVVVALVLGLGLGPAFVLNPPLPSPPPPITLRNYPTRTAQVAQRAADRASRRPGVGGGRQDGVDRVDRHANPYGEGEEHRWRGSAAEQVGAGLGWLGLGLGSGFLVALGWLELLVFCLVACSLPG